jgi:hypothetical protein
MINFWAQPAQVVAHLSSGDRVGGEQSGEQAAEVAVQLACTLGGLHLSCNFDSTPPAGPFAYLPTRESP